MRQTILFFLFACCFTWLSHAADISPITSAFQKGDASTITKLLDAKADVSISFATSAGNSDKAKNLLLTFFAKNKPSALKVLHHADKQSSGFFVGKLQTESGTFRINVGYRSEGNTAIIQSISIE